jgi:hypothetical protein
MKRFFIPFVFIAFILLSCGGAKELKTGNVYTDPVYNFSVPCPNGWRHFVYNGETRLRTVYTEYTRSKERSEVLKMDAGIEIDPHIYIKVITGNKDVKQYVDNLKKNYITEFFNLFSKDVYTTSKTITKEEVTTILGTQEAYSFEIKESHINPQQRNPITQVYGFEVDTIINFTIFKRGENIYHIEFICPAIGMKENLKKYQDLINSLSFK